MTPARRQCTARRPEKGRDRKGRIAREGFGIADRTAFLPSTYDCYEMWENGTVGPAGLRLRW